MKLNKLRIFSFILVITLMITFIPQGTLKIFAEDSLVEETTELETETEEDSEEDWIIDDSFLEEIVPPGSDASINSWLDQPSLYEPVTGPSTVIHDGVFVIQNLGNSNFCMGILNDSTDAGGTVVQVATTSVTSDFDRSCLFKITRVGDTTRYIIRSMLNNRLILSYNGSKFITKEVSPNDANVNINDTFIILGSSSGGYTITPYGGTQVIAAPNSTASDTASAALIKTSSSSAGNRGKWTFIKYVGASKSGISLPISPTNWNYGAKVGTTYTIKLKTWSTEIGANTPYLTVHPDYTDMATYSWNSSTYTLTITPTKEGPIGIRSIIRRDGTTTAFRTYKSVYSVVPDLNGDTAFIQNVGTSKYIDLESASTVEGGIIQQWSFHTGTQAQWIFEVAYGGLFYIKSVRSGMYVGVDPNNTASVKQYATKNTYTQWRLKKTSSGNFAFYCYALESSGLVLSTPLSTNANGDNLTMLAYTNDSNYRDEWYFLNYSQIPNITMDIEEQTTADFSKIKNFSSSPTNFQYTILKGSAYVSVNNSTGIITALKAGDAYIKAVHKSIEAAFIFKVKVRKNAIIIVPGIMGTTLIAGENNISYAEGTVRWGEQLLSELNNGNLSEIQVVERILSLQCDEAGDSTNDVVPYNDLYGVYDTYRPLYESLYQEHNNKYEICFFPYDWRLSCEKSAHKLNEFIANNQYDKVVLVCHSMGGLVASSYISLGASQRDKTQMVITLGSPLLGTPDMPYKWGSGLLGMANYDGYYEWASELFNMISQRSDPVDGLLCHFESVYELFPSEAYFDSNYGNRNYLITSFLGTTSNVVSFDHTQEVLEQNLLFYYEDFANKAQDFHESLFVNGEHITSLVNTYYISGYNINTVYKIEYNSLTWSSNNENIGDGTVPTWSATLGDKYDSKTFFAKNINHTSLVSDGEVMQFINGLINNNTSIVSYNKIKSNMD